MNKLLSLFLLCSISSLAMAQTKAGLGDAICESDVDSGECKISWNFLDSPRTYHRIQKWDKNSNSWRNYGDAVSHDASGLSAETVQDKAFYRVQACNDLDAREDCIGSTTLWAPYIPRTEDEIASIPDRVVRINEDGEEIGMAITKDARYETQVLQYNVYLTVVELQNADFKELPAMAVPPEITIENRDLLTLEDQVWINVYANYTGLREQKLALAKTE